MITVLFKTKKAVIFGLLFITIQSYSQEGVLDNYIQMAFKNSIALQQKNISLEKAMYALKTAESLYQPTIAFQGGYQTGEGGRSISIPVGDLMNPVYSTLNQLTASNKFPQISNSESYFLPHNFYDVKLTTSVPIYNKDLAFNKQIQGQQYELQKTDIDTYKRELVRNIKIAYFNYLLANQSLSIYQNTLLLANEGKRTNERLLANGKGLPAYVLRSESEVQNATAQLNDAQKQASNAKLYFNFLLNRNLEEPIDASFQTESNLKDILQISTEAVYINKREELKLLQQSVELNKTVLKMNQSFWYPKINGFLNEGSQAVDFTINKQSFYYIGGLQIDIPIFTGKRNIYKIRQTELDIQYANKSLELTQQQLNLSASVVKNDLSKYIINYYASVKQLDAASSYQRLLDKGFKEGVNTFIETLDARNQFTNAQLLVVINQFRVLIAAANLERETATFNLSSIK
jgi:outer membrane protein TolC